MTSLNRHTEQEVVTNVVGNFVDSRTAQIHIPHAILQKLPNSFKPQVNMVLLTKDDYGIRKGRGANSFH